jgi:methylthioxylose transferase
VTSARTELCDLRVDRPMSGPGSSAALAPAWTVVPLVGWALLIVVSNRWGEWLLDRGAATRILAPPLIGRFQFGPDRGFDLLVVLAPLAVVWTAIFVPRWAQAMSIRSLLRVSPFVAGAFAVALALVSGWYWLQRPMELPGHYVNDVALVQGPFDFLAGFVDRIDSYGTHVRGHPPGFVLLLWVLDRIGFAGSGWAAVFSITGGALAVPAVLVTTREVAGETNARAAAPFVMVAPVALYVATTADAFFAGVAGWAVAALVLATGRTGRRSDRLALVGGFLAGCSVMLSYGLVLIGTIPLAVAISRRRLRPILVGAGAALAVVASFRLAGFDWFAGLSATRREYLESVASERPYWYFLVANLAALCIVLGPATIVGLARLRDSHAWLLVGGGLAAVALANLSGMSKGEVERIWLPFAVWILPAAATLATSRRSTTGWLAVQASFAAAVQLGVRTHW